MSNQQQSKCPETVDEQHILEWFNVPAQYLNGVSVYPDHQRAQCDGCDQIFVRGV